MTIRESFEKKLPYTIEEWRWYPTDITFYYVVTGESVQECSLIKIEEDKEKEMTVRECFEKKLPFSLISAGYLWEYYPIDDVLHYAHQSMSAHGFVCSMGGCWGNFLEMVVEDHALEEDVLPQTLAYQVMDVVKSIVERDGSYETVFVDSRKGREDVYEPHYLTYMQTYEQESHTCTCPTLLSGHHTGCPYTMRNDK